MVREVPHRAPIISQPLADFQFQVSTSFEYGAVYQLWMMTPGDVGERLVQRAGLSRMYVVAAAAAVGCITGSRPSSEPVYTVD